MAWEPVATNEAVTAEAAKALFITTHSALPATAQNQTGSTRVPINWGAAADGEIRPEEHPKIPLPAGAAVGALGIWSAATGGVLRHSFAVPLEQIGNATEYTVDELVLRISDG